MQVSYFQKSLESCGMLQEKNYFDIISFVVYEKTIKYIGFIHVDH